MASEDESKLEEELTLKLDSAWKDCDEDTTKKIEQFSEEYKAYITKAKTERLAIDLAEEILKEAGFESVRDIKRLKEGDKIYLNNRGKALAAAVVGKNDLQMGCNLLASHIDSPRIDLKARPLYEDNDTLLAVFKTHYYGGIKKYQWVNTPLSIFGRFVKEDGTVVDLHIGDEEDDPVVVISDLLPHLAKKAQGDRKMKEVIKGEELNIIVGGRPIEDESVEKKLKMNILKLLNDEYDIKEEDFISAEIEIVPAGPARDVGLDRSMIGGYGHDDRICAFTSLKACMDLSETPRTTSIVVLFDKEEIGSMGNTGAGSMFLSSFISELLNKRYEEYNYHDFQITLNNSKAISGDVSAAVNPSFKGVHEIMNAPKMSQGIVVTKFTGAGGKFSANDAHAEYVAFIRKIFNGSGVSWQACELGKVDEGGGGTVAKDLSRLNIETIDAGPPVVGMHSPFEIVSKVDLYHTYLGYKAFLGSD
ncbi:MAG: aminopeptidase [Thermoplasmata archaeon]